tara:strand:+ start:449 stop:787 length:339 start_codon:yes stop_codon:yes gene_type:complete
MYKIKVIISVGIFSILLGMTSVIKTKTRIIEKNNLKFNTQISAIKKDLHETQLDYYYLSSPRNLSSKILELDFIKYFPMDFSRIYSSYVDFSSTSKKITILNNIYEQKTKKK